MNNIDLQPVRRKAVWGPKRSLAVTAALLVFGFVPSAFAANGLNLKPKHHAHAAPKAKPGRPNRLVKNYKLDGELTKRTGKNANQTTRAIIELVPGAKLPAAFARYLHKQPGKLSIINGQLLDIPNGMLKQMAANPAVFRIHYDRPVSNFNYRTGLTGGARR